MKFNILILICLVFIPINSSATSDPSKDSLSFDKSIRVGHLPNGFTYYIKPTYEIDKINLRFYVKVGRFNEKLWKTEQYAHLIEHLGYIEGYLMSYYSKNDVTFKKSGNTNSAATDAIYTPYWSSVSSMDTTSLMDRLKWFYNITMMDLEDSVVLREARCVRQEIFYRSKGFELNRFFNKNLRKAAIFFDTDGETPYWAWLTTYDMGGISVPSVRKFYQNWYRPDRMGLIITGDIQDINSLEKELIALFDKIPKATTKMDEFDTRFFYLNSPKKFKTVKRIELNRFSNWNNGHSKTSLYFRVKNFHKVLNTKEKWLNEQIYKSVYAMVYQRLKERGVPTWSIQKGDIVDIQLPDRKYPFLRLPDISNKPGREKENIQKVVTILQKLKKNGFTQQEWNNHKQMIINKISSKDTNSINYWDEQLKNHFVYGEILPAHKKAVIKQWTVNLSLKDINSYLKNNFSVMPDDIYITASSGHPALSFTEEQVRGWVKEAIKKPIELNDVVDFTSLNQINENNTSLMDAKEVENLKRVGYKKIGIDTVTGYEVFELDNGVKILLDQEDPKASISESITICGKSPRGTSSFPEEYYYAAVSATEIIKLSGAGRLNRTTIRNKLGKGHSYKAEPIQMYINQNNSTVKTSAKLEELEKYLQLIYLYFTSPRKDSLVFAQWKKQIRESYFGEIIGGISPKTDMKNAIAEFLNLRSFTAPPNQISTQQYYQKQNVRLEKVMKCYQTIFGDASDFTFIVKGRYKKELVLPLLKKYFGNLPTATYFPSLSSKNIITENNTVLSKGPIYHTFYADIIETGYKLYTVPYTLSYIFPISEENWRDRVVMDLIITYLRPKVGKELRFIKGVSTYSENLEGRYSRSDALYNLSIHVDALDDELERIRSECKKMIAGIKNLGISVHDKNILIQDPLFLGRYTPIPKLHEKVIRYAHSLTSEDIRKVATKYLNKNYQYEFAFKERKKHIEHP